MQLIEQVSVDRVLDAFRNDQKVTALEVPWPATREEKIALLGRPEVGRPVGRILRLEWSLYELDQDEFLSNVYPRWGLIECTVGELLADDNAGRLVLPTPNNVEKLKNEMLVQFKEDLFELVGFLDNPKHIRLEEGHNRVVAANRAGRLPAKVRMDLGK